MRRRKNSIFSENPDYSDNEVEKDTKGSKLRIFFSLEKLRDSENSGGQLEGPPFRYRPHCGITRSAPEFRHGPHFNRRPRVSIYSFVFNAVHRLTSEEKLPEVKLSLTILLR